jgi:DNA polymerase III psi subunit
VLSIEQLENPHDLTFDDFVERVQQTRPVMTVCEAPDIESFTRLISGPPTSLLVTRGAFTAPREILHVLRGHTPDKHVLDWVIPIAQHYEAEITLLAAATAVKAQHGNPLISDFARLILPEHPAQMIEYGQMLASMNLRGRMRVGDRGLENAFVDTLASSNYDLVAIAIENDGKYVKRLWQQFSDYPIAYLIVKP